MFMSRYVFALRFTVDMDIIHFEHFPVHLLLSFSIVGVGGTRVAVTGSYLSKLKLKVKEAKVGSGDLLIRMPHILVLGGEN
jgi:hypothetical protein